METSCILFSVRSLEQELLDLLDEHRTRDFELGGNWVNGDLPFPECGHHPPFLGVLDIPSEEKGSSSSSNSESWAKKSGVDGGVVDDGWCLGGEEASGHNGGRTVGEGASKETGTTASGETKGGEHDEG